MATIGSDFEKTSLSCRLAQEMRSSTREDGVAELPGGPLGGPPGGPGIADGPTGYGVAILESLNQ